MAGARLEEKRLKQLKQQLFGKSEPYTYTSSKKTDSNKNSSTVSAKTTSFESISLRSDFIKILTFSVLALAVQFGLFFANHQGLIRLY